MSYDVVIESLEDTLKAIGLLSEAKKDDDEVEGAFEDASAEENEELDAELDAELEDSSAGDEDDDNLDERIRIKKAFRGGKVQKQARTSYKLLLKGKKQRRSGHGKAALRKRKKVQARAGVKKKRERRAAKAVRRGTRQAMGFDQVANLMDEIQGIVGATQAVECGAEYSENVLEGFQNILDIATLLSEAFAFFAEEDGNEELVALSEGCTKLATAAEAALEELHDEDDEDEIDAEAVESMFKELVTPLLTACDIYESIVDEEGEDEGEVNEDEVNEDDEDDDGYEEEFEGN
jgi:hypothetical protein